MTMFCFQCEQTVGGKGCTNIGICGKKDSTAALQDALIQTVKEIGYYNHLLRRSGRTDSEADRLTLELLFATVTNVNFDDHRLYELFRQGIAAADRLQTVAGVEALEPNVDLRKATSPDELIELAKKCSIPLCQPGLEENEVSETDLEMLISIRELLLYGLKGTAAYAHHAALLGKEADEIYAYFAKALSSMETAEEEPLGLIMESGMINLKAMELLDAAHTERFGHPEPTAVAIAPKKGKAILISGHDLLDLEELLKQTEGRGINIYTHGEMLPAHAYPALKKYPHLAGNYGGAWQDQHKDFAAFPGAVLMTTNCIQNPKGYENRIFTTGCVAWQGIKHIADRKSGGIKDFSPLIAAALAETGFTEDAIAKSVNNKSILVGFGHNAVMNVADKVIAAVKAGKIKHFFLIGGCDGAKTGRNYYTELAEKIPKDCIILTLACGKYRFNKMEFGDIDGIPRLLDIGQCNDAYSAIQIALALAKAFETDINGLPLSIILSWYEQKAVCVLLTLLALGVKNIKLGPSLPAFVAPDMLKILAEKFGIAPITTAEEDIKEILR